MYRVYLGRCVVVVVVDVVDVGGVGVVVVVVVVLVVYGLLYFFVVELNLGLMKGVYFFCNEK